MSWKIAFALFAPVALVQAFAGGCVNDVCTQADNQIAACAPQDIVLPPIQNDNTGQECTPKRACQSDCINRHSCLEINQAQCLDQSACRPIQGPPSSFILCMNACEGVSTPGAGGGDAGDGG